MSSAELEIGMFRPLHRRKFRFNERKTQNFNMSRLVACACTTLPFFTVSQKKTSLRNGIFAHIVIDEYNIFLRNPNVREQNTTEINFDLRSF